MSDIIVQVLELLQKAQQKAETPKATPKKAAKPAAPVAAAKVAKKPKIQRVARVPRKVDSAKFLEDSSQERIGKVSASSSDSEYQPESSGTKKPRRMRTNQNRVLSRKPNNTAIRASIAKVNKKTGVTKAAKKVAVKRVAVKKVAPVVQQEVDEEVSEDVSEEVSEEASEEVSEAGSSESEIQEKINKTYVEMIVHIIIEQNPNTLKLSRVAIKKAFMEKYKKADTPLLRTNLNKAIKKGIEAKIFFQPKGPSGCIHVSKKVFHDKH